MRLARNRRVSAGLWWLVNHTDCPEARCRSRTTGARMVWPLKYGNACDWAVISSQVSVRHTMALTLFLPPSCRDAANFEISRNFFKK